MRSTASTFEPCNQRFATSSVVRGGEELPARDRCLRRHGAVVERARCQHHAHPRGRHVRPRLGSRRRARLETSFDVHGARLVVRLRHRPGRRPASASTSPAMPAGATITGATLKLTSRTGFAFDGDPDHHAIFARQRLLDGELRSRGTRRPAGRRGAAVPPARVAPDGASAQHLPGRARLDAARSSRSGCCRDAQRRAGNFGSANLRTRVCGERAGDGKLSLEVFTIPCGTPVTVVCQNGQLEQSYFLRYDSGGLGPARAAARGRVRRCRRRSRRRA